MSKIKLRPKTQTFMDANRLKAYHCIEICTSPRRWTLLGDDDGVYRFEKVEDRDAKLKELQGLAQFVEDTEEAA